MQEIRDKRKGRLRDWRKKQRKEAGKEGQWETVYRRDKGKDA